MITIVTSSLLNNNNNNNNNNKKKKKKKWLGQSAVTLEYDDSIRAEG